MENTAQNGGPEPGAPDEFANIPTRRTRHPLLALGALALAGVLLWVIHDDVFYALRSSDPQELGDVRVALAGSGNLDEHVNQLVRVRGTPDRESGLEIDTKGSWVFTQFFRLLGTGDRVFVHRPASPLPAEQAERDIFVGRLIRFRDLSFESSIRDYFAARVTATHVFQAADLRSALEAAQASGAPPRLKDMAGDEVVLGPKDEVTVSVVRPDEYVVGVPKERIPQIADARAAIEQRGAQVLRTFEANARPEKSSELSLLLASPGQPVQRHMFIVRVPADARDQVLHRLGDLDYRLDLREARDTNRVLASALHARPDGLILDGAGENGAALSVRTGDVRAVRTLATVQIPPDAYLVQENDLPHNHAFKLVVAAVLVLFAFINIFGLIQGLRGEVRKA